MLRRYKLNLGIGDVIQAKSQLIDFVEAGNQVYVSPNLNVWQKYRNSDQQYLNFIFQFMKLTFTEPGFTVGLDQDCRNGHYSYIEFDGFLPKTIDLTKQLVLPDGFGYDIKSPYIVMNSKIRGMDPHYYQSIKEEFLNILNRIDCKIVLMGEKQLSNHQEYIGLGNEIYLIYNDLIDGLNPDKVIDLTIENLSIPSMINIMNDCYIMNKAKTNITFGIGGSLTLSNSVGNCLALINKESEHYKSWETPISYIYNSKNHQLLTDFNLFNKELLSL